MNVKPDISCNIILQSIYDINMGVVDYDYNVVNDALASLKKKK